MDGEPLQMHAGYSILIRRQSQPGDHWNTSAHSNLKKCKNDAILALTRLRINILFFTIGGLTKVFIFEMLI